jgi:hypothetical protein
LALVVRAFESDNVGMARNTAQEYLYRIVMYYYFYMELGLLI